MMLTCNHKFFDETVKQLIDKMVVSDVPILNWLHYKNGIIKPKNSYSVYNTENLSIKFPAKYKIFLDNALEVFDYSENNIKHYSRAVYIPLLIDKPIDILFYGYNSTRRKETIKSLRSAGLTVEYTAVKTQQLINKSKYVLSLGSFNNDNNDSWRVIPALQMGANVLAETTKETAYDNYLKSLGVILVDYKDITSKAVELCK